MTPLDHLPVDEQRVDVVHNTLSILMVMDDTRSRAWARKVVEELDRHDADRHIHDARGNMTFADETDDDEPATPLV